MKWTLFEDLLYSSHWTHNRRNKEWISLSITISDTSNSPRHMDLLGAQVCSHRSTRSPWKISLYSCVCVCVCMYIFILYRNNISCLISKYFCHFSFFSLYWWSRLSLIFVRRRVIFRAFCPQQLFNECLLNQSLFSKENGSGLETKRSRF